MEKAKKQEHIIWNEDDRLAVVEALRKFPIDRPVKVTISPKRPNRSLAQNNLMWMWFRCIRDHIFETQGDFYEVDPDIHDWFVEEFLPPRVVEIDGEKRKTWPHTRELDVQQFSQFLTMIELFVNTSETLDLVLPHPDDLYWEALGVPRET